MAKKRVCKVKVEKLEERYCGTPTGRIVYHTTETTIAYDARIVKQGCPLGRGYTESESLRDFCFRANSDNAGLNLQASECKVIERKSYC